MYAPPAHTAGIVSGQLIRFDCSTHRSQREPALSNRSDQTLRRRLQARPLRIWRTPCAPRASPRASRFCLRNKRACTVETAAGTWVRLARLTADEQVHALFICEPRDRFVPLRRVVSLWLGGSRLWRGRRLTAQAACAAHMYMSRLREMRCRTNRQRHERSSS
jgi:hypothetical protein